MRFKHLFAAMSAAAMAVVATPSHATAVDLELQLLVDVSGSIDSGEFALQQDGYEAAFRDAGIISAIENGTIGSIAVQLVYWSSASSQAIGVDWALISDGTSANAFADAIAAAARPFSGGTQPDDAINFGAPLFNDNGFEGSRLVMDVSGDGAGTASATAAARDAALAGGVDAINGLVIGSSTSLQDFYMANIVGGAGGFLVVANTFEDFASAVLTKIGREIVGGEVPIPGAIPLMATGLLVLWRRSRRKKASV